MYEDIKANCESILLEKDLTVKGARLERFIYELLESIPGLKVYAHDTKNDKASQEIDLSLWNDRLPDGLHFFENIVLVECKNWKSKASSSDINWFETKLRDNRSPIGIFISANGITGSSRSNTAAYDTILTAHKLGRTIIVITLHELKELTSSAELVELIKRKMCALFISRIDIKVI